MLKAPPLSRSRIRLAIVLAVVADGLQFALGPAGWLGAVQVIDVLAMVATMATIGFHVLLLPTFVIEFFPLLDMAPTWTGCVLAVIALRRRGEAGGARPEAGVPPQIAPGSGSPLPPPQPQQPGRGLEEEL